MIRLNICAFWAFVITFSSAVAQDVQNPAQATGLDTGAQTGAQNGIQTAGLFVTDDTARLIGQDKVAPLCPEFCVPRRVTSPELATVGEREVMSYTMALATSGPKLHVDSRRSLWAQVEKFPSTASTETTPTVATQNEFRPALDPVLAEPITKPTE